MSTKRKAASDVPRHDVTTADTKATSTSTGASTSASAGAATFTSTTSSRDDPISSSTSTAAAPLSANANSILIIIFIVAIIALFIMFQSFPEMSDDERSSLRFPRSFGDLTSLSVILKKYRDQHYWSVVIAFSMVYIFLQTFAIPGAIFLSVLAGPLFGTFVGLTIVSCVATTGATMCYLLSYYLGRGLVQRCFPTLLHSFRQKVLTHRHNLFFYLLFLRVSPLLPNWFISVSSPILDIPIQYFIGATFFGLIPANYLHVTTGLTLDSIGYGQGGGINIRALVTLLGIALLALLPTLFRRKIETLDAKMEKHTD